MKPLCSTDYENNINAKYNVDSATLFADRIREKGGTVYTVGITGGGNLVKLQFIHSRLLV